MKLTFHDWDDFTEARKRVRKSNDQKMAQSEANIIIIGVDPEPNKEIKLTLFTISSP